MAQRRFRGGAGARPRYPPASVDSDTSLFPRLVLSCMNTGGQLCMANFAAFGVSRWRAGKCCPLCCQRCSQLYDVLPAEIGLQACVAATWVVLIKEWIEISSWKDELFTDSGFKKCDFLHFKNNFLWNSNKFHRKFPEKWQNVSKTRKTEWNVRFIPAKFGRVFSEILRSERRKSMKIL